MAAGSRTLHVAAGPGVVVRFGDVIGVVLDIDQMHAEFVGEFLGLMRAVADEADEAASIVRLARRLAGLLALSDPTDVPSFAAANIARQGAGVFVHGAMDVVWAHADGHRELITGQNVLTWVDRRFHGAPISFQIKPSGATDLEADPLTSLDRGVVRGVGVTMPPHQAAPDTTAPVATETRVTLLVRDDDVTIPITGRFVIGREPESDAAVQAADAQPLAVDDADHSVSRRHAYLTPVAGGLVVEDAGSANGTFVGHGGSRWVCLRAGERATLAAGDMLRVGDRVFRVQIVSQQVEA